jgi:hypothetical protein
VLSTLSVMAHEDMPGSEDADSQLRGRMRDGRLAQILRHVDGIEDHLNDISELVARLQRDDAAGAGALERSGFERDERSITGACWPNPPSVPSPSAVLIQEDSASL